MRTAYSIAVAATLLFLACGEETKPLPADSDTATDDTTVTDADTAVPGDEFFATDAANSFRMEFKGLINSYGDMVAGKQVKGIGSFEYSFAGEKYAPSGDPEAYLSTIPADYEDPEMAGKDYLRIQLYAGPLEQGTNSAGNGWYTYDYINIGIPLERFTTAFAGKENIFPLDDISWANLMSLTLTARADGKYFYRYCYVSLPQRDPTDGAWFTDHRNNDSFAAGEDLILWANLTMGEKQVVTAENEESLCLYQSQTAELTKAEYEAEITKSGTEFGCEIPEKYTTAFANDRALITFIGEISDIANNETILAYADYDVTVGGAVKTVADYTAYAYPDDIGTSTNYMVAQTLGNVFEFVPSRHYLFDYTRLLIPLGILQGFPAEDESFELSLPNIYFQYLLLEQKLPKSGGSYIKGCIYAMHTQNELNGVFVCRAGATDFLPGDPYHIAANIELSADTDYLMEQNGVSTPDDLCFCYNETTGASITCEDFDLISVEL